MLDKLSDLIGPERMNAAHFDAIVGTVRRDTALGWVLSLELVEHGVSRVRQLDAKDCDDLGVAAAVALALVLNPESAAGDASESVTFEGREHAATPVVVASTQPPPSSAIDSPAASAAGAPAVPAVHVVPELAAEGVFDGATLGAAAFGLGASAAARLGDLSLAIYGLYLPARQSKVRAGGEQVEFALLTAGLRACYGIGQGIVSSEACAGFEGGQFSASGVGLLRSRTVHDIWLAPALGVALGWPVNRNLGLELRAEGVAPLNREQYVINATEDIYRVPVALLRLALGLRVRLD